MVTELANRSAYYIVACEQEQIIGFAGMWVVMDEAHITTLAVGGTRRRHGIGEQLLVGLLEEAVRRGLRIATLEVRTSNWAAQTLYAKYGFRAVAIRRQYYTDNDEDAVVMWIDDLTADSFREMLSGNNACLDRKRQPQGRRDTC